MTDIILEIIRAGVAIAILAFLVWTGRRLHLWDESGWPIIVGGFALLTLGSVIDITDNFQSLDVFVVVGDTPQQAFVEKVVGFLGGFVLLSVGFWRWLPIVGAVRESRQDLVIHNAGLQSVVEQRNAELLKSNHALEGEVAFRRRAERQLADQVEDLEEARDRALAAIKAKSLFFANMNHELRTPLTGLIGMSAQLERETFGPLNKKQAQYVSHIVESGDHLLSLINDLLDLAKAESEDEGLALGPVSLSSVLAESVALVDEVAFSGDVTLTIEIPNDLPFVVGDQRRLVQVFVNLLSNAIRFTPVRGSVKIVATTHDNRIEVAVVDSGIGIAVEDLIRIFQPFEQVGEEVSGSEGTGLGLALTKRLVKLNGGTISVESSIGVGSTFAVSLAKSEIPVLEEADHDAATINQIHRADGNNRIRVLLAEDDKVNQLFLYDALSAAGFEVAIVENGRQAVEQATTFHPDSILMDMRMPVMGGLEATRLLKASPSTQEIPVIALTAQAMPGDDEECYEAGCDTYLTKPIDIDELIRAIRFFSETSPHLNHRAKAQPHT